MKKLIIKGTIFLSVGLNEECELINFIKCI